jgi:hypothetical protein
VPHAFMDDTGFKIAKPTFDARTAAEINLLFSSSSSSLAQYITGLATPTGGGGINDQFDAATVNFGKTYANPPMCFFAGIMPSGRANTTIGMYYLSDGLVFANLYGITSTTQLRLYAHESLGVVSFRYFIMENTLQ